MINFCLPGLYDNFELNKKFIELVKGRERQYLNDDVNICAVYGCFPTSIWNGGRKVNGYCSAETVKERIKYFNDLSIACRYTFLTQF